ncbi:MAG: CarD family transcriptional regulator [Lachnospiraceae bacterium]|nr:CarD family transcriptional regulator [Lachnospiraceae bacterium]
MFEKGDYIVHGTNGVCQVEGVTRLDISGADKDRMYYILTPVNSKGSRMYSPIDNTKVVVRRILTEKEALDLIDDIPNIKGFTIENEKQRENMYKEAVRTCDCRELVKIIKTLYDNRQKRMAEGKKTTSIDEKYFQLAEDNLYSELAVSMGKEKSGIVSYISKRMKELGVD